MAATTESALGRRLRVASAATQAGTAPALGLSRREGKVMETILIIVVLLFLFGGGGYYWRSRRRG
jgi:hypothetical protein